MNGLKDKTLLGEEIESITLGKKKIHIKLKNGEKISCKPIGSMNFTASLKYSKKTLEKTEGDCYS